MADPAPRRVITETTRLVSVPYVPEIRLQQAEDPFTVWEQVETTVGGPADRAELPPPFWAFAWAGGQALARYLLDGDAGGAGVVLCADAFYEEDLAGRILGFLHRAKAGGARVLVGDPGRAFLRTAGFVPLASYEIPVTIALEGVTSKQGTVYEVMDAADGG